jgi:hypothetical protein
LNEKIKEKIKHGTKQRWLITVSNAYIHIHTQICLPDLSTRKSIWLRQRRLEKNNKP